MEWGELDYLLLDLPPGTGDVALDVHTMLPTSKEIIVTTPHPTAAFVAARAGAMAVRTNHEVVGVIENMSYFESQTTGEREYIFGKGGGQKLAEELQTDLLGQLPLGQPDWNDDDFAPSVYGEDHPIGKVYMDIAKKSSQSYDEVASFFDDGLCICIYKGCPSNRRTPLCCLILARPLLIRFFLPPCISSAAFIRISSIFALNSGLLNVSVITFCKWARKSLFFISVCINFSFLDFA